MHGSGMMQHAPAIDDVERAESAKIVAIQHRPALDGPVGVARAVQLAQLLGAQHRSGIVIERVHTRAETARGERKQPAAGADIDEAQAGEGFATKQHADRLLALGDLLGAEVASEVEPVLAKSKTPIVALGVQHSRKDLKVPAHRQLYDLAPQVATSRSRRDRCTKMPLSGKPPPRSVADRPPSNIWASIC